MNLREKQFRIALAAAAVWGFSAFGQTPDNSQNGLLKGTYNFRHVAVQNVDANNDPSEVTAVFGTITFDGAGNYTLSGTLLDNTGAYTNGPFSVTNGTYAIGSNGLGYISNPLYSSPPDAYDNIYGAVSQGVFVGSSTEAYDEQYYLNDLFIAIPAASGQTTASFTTSYQTGVLDFTGGLATAVKNGLFELTPNGKGGLGTITVTGQASNLANPSVTQTITGGTYAISGGAGSLSIPLPTGIAASSAVFTGQKTFYQSADGNFILGWTASGYDVFFGVKALSGTATNSTAAGLYFTAGLEDAPQTGAGVDSYYGGTSNTADTAGDAIVHQRINYPGYYSEDFGLSMQNPLNSNGSSNDSAGYYNYQFGAGGNAFVAVGLNGYYSLVVGLHAATFTGSGVFLNPIGVVNAASYQPVTASIAPGELLTLFGTGLSSGTVTTKGGNAFPTTLNNVQVTIDSIPCPIYYVSPTQIAVITPYAIDANTSYLANIQVNNNGAKSNIVQVNVTDVAAGVFSQTANGLGAAAALHAATYQLVTASNPAQPGESLAVYLTGLGTVSPTISDGALGSSTTPLNTADINTAANLTVNFVDQTTGTRNAATIEYAGLAPGLAGLYQINVQVPSTGLGSGDQVTLEFITQYADFNQIAIPYGSASVGAAAPVRAGMRVRKALAAKHRTGTSKRKSRVPAGAPAAYRE